MTSLLIGAEIDNGVGERERLTDSEIVAFALLLSGAAGETVTKLLGNAVMRLARIGTGVRARQSSRHSPRASGNSGARQGKQHERLPRG